MPEYQPQEIITNDGWTEALFNMTPDEFAERITRLGLVISQSKSQSGYEFVLENNGESITISVCETDDENTIQTEYSLEDFIADSEDMPERANTFLISQENQETIEDFFTSDRWLGK